MGKHKLTQEQFDAATAAEEELLSTELYEAGQRLLDKLYIMYHGDHNRVIAAIKTAITQMSPVLAAQSDAIQEEFEDNFSSNETITHALNLIMLLHLEGEETPEETLATAVALVSQILDGTDSAVIEPSANAGASAAAVQAEDLAEELIIAAQTLLSNLYSLSDANVIDTVIESVLAEMPENTVAEVQGIIEESLSDYSIDTAFMNALVLVATMHLNTGAGVEASLVAAELEVLEVLNIVDSQMDAPTVLVDVVVGPEAEIELVAVERASNWICYQGH